MERSSQAGDRMHTTPFDGPFGALLHLDDDGPLGASERERLRRLFAEHGLLVVRGQEISSDRQVDLLSAIGRVEPEESGAPMLMEVTNQHDRTTAPDGELVFHYDYAYDPAPIPAISLYATLCEGKVTPTCFTSSAAVLDRLPRDLIDRLREVDAVHACFLHRLDAPEVRSVEPDPLIPRGEPGWGPEHYWHHHPAILETPFGAETLFVCLQHTDRIEGLPRAESEAILEQIYAELYAPPHVYTHRWEPHDLVIWDNLTVQHARPEPLPGPRTLRRFHVSEVDLTADYLRVGRENGLV